MIAREQARVGGANGRLILAMLRRAGAASKAELARGVGLTNNAAGMIVAKLIASGLIREVGKRYGGRGQPATLLRLEPGGAYAIGARLERAGSSACVVDFEGRPLERLDGDRLDIGDAAAVLDGIAGMVDRLTRALGVERSARLVGVGVALPETPPPGLGLAQSDGPSMLFETAGNAAAAGELFSGEGRRVADFLSLLVGPSLGGSVVMGGDFRRGPTGHAGDWGAMPVGGATPGEADRGGALMARASLDALASRYAARLGRSVSVSELGRMIAEDDATFVAWLVEAATALARPLMTAVRLLDIHRVVIDGDLAPPSQARLIQAVERALASQSDGHPIDIEVTAGSIGPRAVEVGAACLPLHIAFGPIADQAHVDWVGSEAPAPAVEATA